MLDTKVRNLSSLIDYTMDNYNSDVFQLITVEAEDHEDEIKKLKIIASRILEKHQARLYISFNNHELGSYMALEILEIDFQKNREIEGLCYQIAEDLGYEF